MSKLKRYIKTEADVEFMAAIHGCSLTFVYGFIQWVSGVEAVPFTVIFWQLMLGYAIAWAQKGLFLREKSYKKWEYRMLETLWCVIPLVLTIAAGILFQWFETPLCGLALAFYGIMFSYYIMLWFFLKFFYREETREMNELLQKRKQKEGKL